MVWKNQEYSPNDGFNGDEYPGIESLKTTEIEKTSHFSMKVSWVFHDKILIFPKWVTYNYPHINGAVVHPLLGCPRSLVNGLVNGLFHYY